MAVVEHSEQEEEEVVALLTAVLLLTKVRGPSGSSADPRPRRGSTGPEMTAFTAVLQKAFGSACCCLQYIIRMKHAGRCQVKTHCPSSFSFCRKWC